MVQLQIVLWVHMGIDAKTIVLPTAGMIAFKKLVTVRKAVFLGSLVAPVKQVSYYPAFISEQFRSNVEALITIHMLSHKV